MIPENVSLFVPNIKKCHLCDLHNNGICLSDNVSTSLHAHSGYCPTNEFPAAQPKPDIWETLERETRSFSFTPKTPSVEIANQVSDIIMPPKKWHEWENVRAAFRMALKQTAENLPAYPSNKYKGYGVVIPAGGRLLESAYVTIRILRFVGCTLPIELWHLPDERLEDWHREALQGLGVSVINAGDVQREHPWRRIGGWELKVYAVMHSRFEHVLLLDADCYPIRDPACLFNSAEYRKHGAIFWPDKKDFDLTREQCEILGIPYFDEPDIESGEFFIDKRRRWRELSLTHWINQHSDYYYKVVFGDKSTHHIAYRFLGTEYAMPPSRWEYARPAMIQKDFTGNPLFIHRSEGKMILGDESGPVFGQNRTGQFSLKERYNPALPLEKTAWAFLDDLRAIRDKFHNHGYIFGRVYAKKEWGNGSGPGSAPQATAQYRELLEKILHSGRIKRVVDLGCGDWQFSKLVNWAGVEYLGVDCVQSLIETNKKEYGNSNIRFQLADLQEFEPPPCDLILVKDVLQHWPLGDIHRFLSRYAGKELLITNTVAQPGHGQTNGEIKAGAFRPLDLTAAPFSVARAKVLLDWIVGVDDRKQTLLLPSPVDLVHGVNGIGKALWAKKTTVAENRQAICNTNECGHAVSVLGVFQKCGVCGCNTWAKTRVNSEACPIGKWPKTGTTIAFIQLGRAGDILILIPALKFLAGMGVKVKLVTRPEYAAIAKGLPGIEVIEFDGEFTEWEKAEIKAREFSDEVRVTQCGFNNRRRAQPNFALEGFYRTGVPVSLFHTLPLVLENRNKAVEKEIASQYEKPVILFNATGMSTPYANGRQLLEEIKIQCPGVSVLDLGNVKAPRIQDLLGLYEQAKMLVTTDTATLHLGYATGIPTVALVSDVIDGASPTRAHWIERITYAESRTAAGKQRLLAALAKGLQ